MKATSSVSFPLRSSDCNEPELLSVRFSKVEVERGQPRRLLLAQSRRAVRRGPTSAPDPKRLSLAHLKGIVLASPTTAAKIIRAVKAQVRAASARELASDHLCLGMIFPVANVTRNSASIGSMRLATEATKLQRFVRLLLWLHAAFAPQRPRLVGWPAVLT